MYLPFLYLEKIKRPGRNYFLKLILADDFPLLLLAFTWGTSNPLWHGLGIFLLLMSFWCIYEVGYYENDLVGEKYEEKPVLSHNFSSYKVTMNFWQPWVWASILGVLGVFALDINRGLVPPVNQVFSTTNYQLLNLNLLSLTYWMECLILSRFSFWIYNYSNKKTRVWFYWLLQMSRYYGFAIIFPINLIGAILLSSHIISRSTLYMMYRYSGGSKWPGQIPEKFLRWLIFIFLLATLAIGTHSLSVWQSWQTWTIFSWLTLQGINPIKQVIREFKLVKQDSSN